MREFSVDMHPRQQEVIKINCGWVIDGFTMGNNPHIGGQGGNHRQFALMPGETITKVNCYSKNCLT